MDYKSKIIQDLSRRKIPCDVEKIRVDVGIGNWNTCIHHLLELYIEGKIGGQRTSKGWVFWKKE